MAITIKVNGADRSVDVDGDKRPEDFKLIGTSAKRLDTPAKVNGSAIFGIDARPPGMKIATLAQSPLA
jgi:isoquinoline 1-oxidoreductase subunit beta